MITHPNTTLYNVCHTLILYSFIVIEMSKTDIDEIVLVGGTTRIPLVKQQLKCVLRFWLRCNFTFFTFYIHRFFPKFLKLLVSLFTCIFLFIILSISQAFFLFISFSSTSFQHSIYFHSLSSILLSIIEKLLQS